MQPLYERIHSLCKEKGTNITQMCKDAGVPRSALSDYKAGRIKSISTEKLLKIADYFGISLDELLGRQGPAPAQREEDVESLPPLNSRDRRDIAKRLQSTLDWMDNSTDGLMFDGEPLDDESKELLRISLQNQLELGKRLAKKKFTPKKYRKE